MVWPGIPVYASYNTYRGCFTHHNMVTASPSMAASGTKTILIMVIPYPQGFNRIQDNISADNSDVGLTANGGNSDGIAISSGRMNTVSHNTVYANSDDGIDTWRSNDHKVEFNLVYDNAGETGTAMG